MMTASKYFYFYYIAIDKDGKQYKISESLVIGTWEAKRHLQEKFGVDSPMSTVGYGKKIYTPVKFGYAENKEHLLAWCNWVLFYPKSKKTRYFWEYNKQFIKNNPIVDLKIGISLSPIDTEYQTEQ